MNTHLTNNFLSISNNKNLKLKKGYSYFESRSSNLTLKDLNDALFPHYYHYD